MRQRQGRLNGAARSAKLKKPAAHGTMRRPPACLRYAPARVFLAGFPPASRRQQNLCAILTHLLSGHAAVQLETAISKPFLDAV